MRLKSLQSRNHSEACRLCMETCPGATSEGRARKECEACRKDKVLSPVLRAEDAKIQAEKDIVDKTATDAAISAGSSSVIPQGEPVNTSNTNAGSAMAEDVPVPSTPEPTRYFPMTPDAAMEPESPVGQMSTEMFATDDFVMSQHLQIPAPPSPEGGDRKSKIIKPTTHAEMEVDDRAKAQVHDRSTGSTTSPQQPDQKRAKEERVKSHVHERSTSNTSSPQQPEQKRVKGDDDENMGDLRILASILRGIDITKVYSPQRVVEVCHKCGLVKGDSFDLRAGSDLSDRKAQKAVTQRTFETNTALES